MDQEVLDCFEVMELEQDSYFAKGGQRACFEVPDDAGLCVKVEFREDQASLERVEEELKAHRKVLARTETSSVVSIFRGQVETNLGVGYLFDLIRNSDGTIAPTIRNCGEELGQELILKLVKDFYHEIVAQKLVVGDLHPKNLVVKDRSRLVLIDGLGAVNFVWLYYYVGPLRVFKLRRKFRRLCRFLGISAKGVLGG